MSATQVKAMNQVVHFEIPVDDMEAAKEFYSIFGWDLIDMPGMEYIGIQTTPVDKDNMPKTPGAINGGMMKRTKAVKSPVFAIWVDSVDDYIKKVIAKGGKLVMSKIEIPNMGYYAYVADPQGNILGLWETIC